MKVYFFHATFTSEYYERNFSGTYKKSDSEEATAEWYIKVTGELEATARQNYGNIDNFVLTAFNLIN